MSVCVVCPLSVSAAASASASASVVCPLSVSVLGRFFVGVYFFPLRLLFVFWLHLPSFSLSFSVSSPVVRRGVWRPPSAPFLPTAQHNCVQPSQFGSPSFPSLPLGQGGKSSTIFFPSNSLSLFLCQTRHGPPETHIRNRLPHSAGPWRGPVCSFGSSTVGGAALATHRCVYFYCSVLQRPTCSLRGRRWFAPEPQKGNELVIMERNG